MEPILTLSQKLNITNERGYRFDNHAYGNVDVFRTFT